MMGSNLGTVHQNSLYILIIQLYLLDTISTHHVLHILLVHHFALLKIGLQRSSFAQDSYHDQFSPLSKRVMKYSYLLPIILDADDIHSDCNDDTNDSYDAQDDKLLPVVKI